MRYQVLGSDYDGTLALHGRVDEPTVAALERFLASGRRLVLVTGRELPELLEIFPQIDLFELVVAENGALLYRPSTKEEKPIAEPPPPEFAARLRERGVERISEGRVIVATWEPHENTVLDVIREMGLDLQVIFNKGAVMILPAGVNKAFGFKAALKEMGLSPHNAIGVGDAENDHALLRYCEFSAAVSNALPAVKDTADFATPGDHGAGVIQLIDAVIATDLAEYEPRMPRHRLVLGKREDDSDFTLPPYGPSILLAGPSASGKSTFSQSFMEVLIERKYQFCMIDPEGDYENFEGAVTLGGANRAPVADEVLQLLQTEKSVVVTLTGMPIPDRPPFFMTLLPQLLQLRAKTSRPHWLLLDEAHHLLPAEWRPPDGLLPELLHSTLMVTVHPNLLAESLLKRITAVVATGKDSHETLSQCASSSGAEVPSAESLKLEPSEILVWQKESSGELTRVKPRPSHTDRRRHRRKYAEGELAPDRSFYFVGAEGKLNLRAQNLMLFLQIADGLDEATWFHHLKQGDYSRWFRDGIKDDSLAAEAKKIESMSDVSADESRRLMRAAVEKEYTLPATALPVAGAH